MHFNQLVLTWMEVQNMILLHNGDLLFQINLYLTNLMTLIFKKKKCFRFFLSLCVSCCGTWCELGVRAFEVLATYISLLYRILGKITKEKKI